MARPPRAFRLGSILWSLGIGAVVVVIGGSMLLPSTKRSRLSAEQLRLRQERYDREQADAAAAEAAATQPSTGPTTQPATGPTSGPTSEPSAEL